MFTLRKTFRFEASHILPAHKGKCSRLHGHSFVMHVELSKDTLIDHGPSQGMVLDFVDIKGEVEPLIHRSLDHYHLNDSTHLENPTCEELARWVHEQIRDGFSYSFRLAVTIEETCTSSCRYDPEWNDEDLRH
jgi:6-pyruvoyltetrahydropterin/6-carboxytetrahydropterin synthase